MRKLFPSLLVVLCMLGTTAQAGALEDEVRAALGAEDYAGLEVLLADAHAEALAARDFSSLRRLYGDLFVTANRERFATTETWLEAYPASPYAATALAWSHHHRSFLLRGERSLRATSREAIAAYKAERNAARALNDIALAETDDFMPALDLALLLLVDTPADSDAIKPLVAHALEIAPSRRSLQLARAALSFNWGGTLEDNIDLCVSLAQKVPGYDAELCLIELAFENKATGALREAALAALDTRDEPFLDYARLDAYLREWRGRPEAPEEAQRIHRASLDGNIDVPAFEQNLEQIVATFGLTFYWVEVRDAPLDVLRTRLADDPQNYRLAIALIEELLDRRSHDDPSVDMGEVVALWPDMLALGAHEPDVWRLGAVIAIEPTGWPAYDRQAPFYANRIYYSNHDAGSLKSYMNDLFNGWMIATGEVSTGKADVDTELLKDMVLCPLIRVGRLFDAACAANPGAAGCNVGGWGSDFPGRVRRLTKSETACEWERTADIKELMFAPVPVSEFLKESVR